MGINMKETSESEFQFRLRGLKIGSVSGYHGTVLG